MVDVPRPLRRAVSVLALVLGVLSVHGVLAVLDASGHGHPTALAAAMVDVMATDGGDGHHDAHAPGPCAECLVVAAASALAVVAALLVSGSAAIAAHPRSGASPAAVWARAARRPPPPTLALLQVSLR